MEGPAIVTSPHNKLRALPDHPNPASAIVGPQKAASLPGRRSPDRHHPFRAIKAEGGNASPQSGMLIVSPV